MAITFTTAPTCTCVYSPMISEQLTSKRELGNAQDLNVLAVMCEDAVVGYKQRKVDLCILNGMNFEINIDHLQFWEFKCLSPNCKIKMVANISWYMVLFNYNEKKLMILKGRKFLLTIFCKSMKSPSE